jgi:hypothetical protein
MTIPLSRVQRWGRGVADSLGILNLLDRRDRQRVKADFRARLSGPCGLVQARGLDATRRGIGVLAAHPIEKGVMLLAEIVELGNGGFAYVRHCDPKPDGTYAIGLEFCNELKVSRAEWSRGSTTASVTAPGVPGTPPRRDLAVGSDTNR